MENIMENLPAIISAVLALVLILTVITNIITEVVKKLTWDKLPTNVLAVLVAMVLTLCAFFAACQIMGLAVTVHGGGRHRGGFFRGVCGHVWL